MYKKKLVQKSKRNLLAKIVFVDGIRYESLFSVAIDFELSYSWLFTKIMRGGGAPVTISGHTIVLASWLEQHPEYDITGKTPVGGINTDKEASK